MPVRLERDLHRAVVKAARQWGWMVLKVETIANVGWPDVILVPPPLSDVRSPGHTTPLWVEFKREGQELTPIQRHVHSLLAKRGQRVYTVRTREQDIALLSQYE